MATRKVMLEDGNGILLEDGTNFLVKDGVAQASDDVLIRLGPKVSDVAHSGLVAPNFIASGGGSGAAISPYYSTQQEWWNAA